MAADEIGRRAEIVPDFAELPPDLLRAGADQAGVSESSCSTPRSRSRRAASSASVRGAATTASGSKSRITAAASPSSDRERLFDPFFTTRAAGQGVGLGLALARTVILRHRGTIDVRSRLGVGTVVRVTLPIQPALTLLANVRQLPINSARGSPARAYQSPIRTDVCPHANENRSRSMSSPELSAPPS
jgi:hypothetical protein